MRLCTIILVNIIYTIYTLHFAHANLDFKTMRDSITSFTSTNIQPDHIVSLPIIPVDVSSTPNPSPVMTSTPVPTTTQTLPPETQQPETQQPETQPPEAQSTATPWIAGTLKPNSDITTDASLSEITLENPNKEQESDDSPKVLSSSLDNDDTTESSESLGIISVAAPIESPDSGDTFKPDHKIADADNTLGGTTKESPLWVAFLLLFTVAIVSVVTIQVLHKKRRRLNRSGQEHRLDAHFLRNTLDPTFSTGGSMTLAMMEAIRNGSPSSQQQFQQPSGFNLNISPTRTRSNTDNPQIYRSPYMLPHPTSNTRRQSLNSTYVMPNRLSPIIIKYSTTEEVSPIPLLAGSGNNEHSDINGEPTQEDDDYSPRYSSNSIAIF